MDNVKKILLKSYKLKIWINIDKKVNNKCV